MVRQKRIHRRVSPNPALSRCKWRERDHYYHRYLYLLLKHPTEGEQGPFVRRCV